MEPVTTIAKELGLGRRGAATLGASTNIAETEAAVPPEPIPMKRVDLGQEQRALIWSHVSSVRLVLMNGLITDITFLDPCQCLAQIDTVRGTKLVEHFSREMYPTAIREQS